MIRSRTTNITLRKTLLNEMCARVIKNQVKFAHLFSIISS